MDIGNKIKELRHSRGITQEELARALGISFQAVSKWECGISLPDITTAPTIASYFGISLDELFDFNTERAESEITAIADEAYKYRESDPEMARHIIEEGLVRYPDCDILLNNLLYVMNYSKSPDETIVVASRLIGMTRKADVKYDALRFLAYAYHAKGDDESALAAIDQIPEIYFTALTEKAYLLKGERGFDAAEKQKHISFENLLQMIWKTAEYYESVGERSKAIRETRRALDFVSIMDHSAYSVYKEFFVCQLERLNMNKM